MLGFHYGTSDVQRCRQQPWPCWCAPSPGKRVLEVCQVWPKVCVSHSEATFHSFANAWHFATPFATETAHSCKCFCKHAWGEGCGAGGGERSAGAAHPKVNSALPRLCKQSALGVGVLCARKPGPVWEELGGPSSFPSPPCLASGKPWPPSHACLHETSVFSFLFFPHPIKQPAFASSLCRHRGGLPPSSSEAAGKGGGPGSEVAARVPAGGGAHGRASC